jgi:ribosome-associated protein
MNYQGVSKAELTAKKLARKIADLSLEKKAEDVVILDLRRLTTMTDFFVICTGASSTQVKAISDHIAESLRNEKIRVLHIEGERAQEWILLDFVNVVAHVFQPEKREFYALERLWGDAKIEEVTDTPRPSVKGKRAGVSRRKKDEKK